MSTVIEKLVLKNFERYRRVEIDFSAGLNLVRGRNSTGKTTILNALTFALFGEAPEVRPRLLVSRLPGSGEMSVYVKFRSPRSGQVVEVERRGGLDRNGDYKTESRMLKIDGKAIPVDSEEVLKQKVTELLGMSLRRFLNLVYVRQGGLNEILSPNRDQMDSILGITLMREVREQFKEVCKELERFEGEDVMTKLRILEEQIPKYDSDLSYVNKDIENLENEIKELSETVSKAESKELSELLASIKDRDSIEQELNKNNSKIQAFLEQTGSSSIIELEEKLNSCSKKLENLASKKSSLEETVKYWEEKWSVTRAQVENFRRQIREHKELAESGLSKCPKCGQEINPLILQRILKEDQALLKGLEEEEESLRKTVDSNRSELKQVLDELKQLETNHYRLASAMNSIGEALKTVKELLDEKSLILELINKRLTSLNLPLKPEDPYLALKIAQLLPIQPEELARKKKDLEEKMKTLEEKKRRRDKILEEVEKARGLLDKLKKRVEKANLVKTLAKSLEKAIEERRRELLRRMEFKALEYYRTMTDQHVYDAIRIDPEDYSVWVHPRGLTEPIPANRVGGGHQTIISLAIRLALLDSLNLRSILILDEPTYGVDSQNLPQIANYIGEVSKYISQMILVTHHSICEEEASNIINVVVQEDGTSKVELEA
ncbi:MAG: AAA family ATPase [Candidatus Brockarchaeota archaeon]|nr:AAA family ATPase [Candidatus Brockarchaeota archaeon]